MWPRRGVEHLRECRLDGVDGAEHVDADHLLGALDVGTSANGAVVSEPGVGDAEIDCRRPARTKRSTAASRPRVAPCRRRARRHRRRARRRAARVVAAARRSPTVRHAGRARAASAAPMPERAPVTSARVPGSIRIGARSSHGQPGAGPRATTGRTRSITKLARGCRRSRRPSPRRSTSRSCSGSRRPGCRSPARTSPARCSSRRRRCTR